MGLASSFVLIQQLRMNHFKIAGQESREKESHRILSSWPLKASIDRLNSSEMSSLCASKRRRMRSTLSANHSRTPIKSYPRSVRCFSPLKIPGVSTMEMPFNTSDLVLEHWKRLRNALPNFDKGRNCFLGSTTKALPGITPSCSACMTAINLEKITWILELRSCKNKQAARTRIYSVGSAAWEEVWKNWCAWKSSSNAMLEIWTCFVLISIHWGCN